MLPFGRIQPPEGRGGRSKPKHQTQQTPATLKLLAPQGERMPGGQVRGGGESSFPVAQLLACFPEIVERAAAEYEPHFITHYLIELAGTFNAWYANTRVLDGTADAPGKLALVDAVRQTLKNGLWLLGCSAPEEM